MSDFILDAVGTVAIVGDTVVFSPGQRGAQQMISGEVQRITQKGVVISVDEGKYKTNPRSPSTQRVVRKSGCFVIVFKKEATCACEWTKSRQINC